MDTVSQFVFHKDYVVKGPTDALITPYLLPSNSVLGPSCLPASTMSFHGIDRVIVLSTMMSKFIQVKADED